MTTQGKVLDDYRLHDLVALDIGWHCHWCGTPLEVAPAGQAQANHCGRLHARKHSQWRGKRALTPIGRCPRPDKKAYGARGTALRFALAYQQYPYLCACGAFHLTCHPKKAFADALAHLAQVIPTGELAS